MNKQLFCIITLIFCLVGNSLAQDNTAQTPNQERDNFITSVTNDAINNNTAIGTHDINKLVSALDADGIRSINNDLSKARIDTSLCDKYATGFTGSTTAAIADFCKTAIWALNGDQGSTATISSNFHKGMYEIAKFLTYGMTVVAANTIYVFNDLFAKDHTKYLTYFSKITDHQKNIDNNINNELNTLVANSNLNNADLQALKAKLLTELQKNTKSIDVNQFSSVPLYSDDQKINADLIKRLAAIMSLPPRQIVIKSPTFSLKKYPDNGSPPYFITEFPLSNTAKNNNLDNLIQFANNTPEYVDYNLQSNFALITRAINLNALLRIYYTRQTSDNLAQNEFTMATQELSQDYYDRMAKAPLATINLEILRSLNKLVYFMYQTHVDNERLQLLQAVNGLLLSQASSSFLDEMQYDKAGKLIYHHYCKDMTDYTSTPGCLN